MKMGTRGLDDVSDGEVWVQSAVLECTFVDWGISPTVTGHRVRAVILPKFKNPKIGQVSKHTVEICTQRFTLRSCDVCLRNVPFKLIAGAIKICTRNRC